jgi:hypothetical protein
MHFTYSNVLARTRMRGMGRHEWAARRARLHVFAVVILFALESSTHNSEEFREKLVRVLDAQSLFHGWPLP